MAYSISYYAKVWSFAYLLACQLIQIADTNLIVCQNHSNRFCLWSLKHVLHSNTENSLNQCCYLACILSLCISLISGPSNHKQKSNLTDNITSSTVMKTSCSDCQLWVFFCFFFKPSCYWQKLPLLQHNSVPAIHLLIQQMHTFCRRIIICS